MKKTIFVYFLALSLLSGCVSKSNRALEISEPSTPISTYSSDDKKNDVGIILPPKETPQLQGTTNEAKTKITQNNGIGLHYKNESDGFEFTFDTGYKNLWYSETQEYQKYTEGDIVKNYVFYIKNTPNPDIFVIHVFKTSWWNTNTEIDAEKESWLKNTPRDLSTALGIFLGSNKNFTFTLWPNNQTCPDLGEKGPGPLCKLTENKVKMVIDTFKIIR